MPGTYTITMQVTQNGVADQAHVFSGVSAKDGTFIGDHFIEHTLKKIMGMMPEPDDTSADGTNNVVFTFDTVRDATGVRVGGQKNDWPILSDAAVGALRGAFDDGFAKLDHRLMAHHHRK